MPEKTLLETALTAAPAIVGAAIAAVMQAREPSEKTPWQKAGDFAVDTVIGATCAYFLTGWAVEFFNQTSANAIAGIGFVLGAMGVQIVRWFIKDGFTWLRTRFGGAA